MPPAKNAMEIFQHLDKSNCRECGEKTCLAFAGAVFQKRRRIEECPRLDSRIVERFSGEEETLNSVDLEREKYFRMLKKEISAMDLADAALRTGGRFENGKLTVKILGKDFSVDREGNLFADIHVNPWVAIPFLNYVLHCRGLTPSGSWMSFRELKEGAERYPLFQKRCEEAMKRVADIYTDLFDDMVSLFAGTQVERYYDSDISVVLRPLPKIPIMICYWKPDEGLTSSLNLFFDETATENLDIGSIFSLGAGLAQMFTKLALRHGIDVGP
jgi:hypothetical protein